MNYSDSEKFIIPLMFLILASITVLLWLVLRNKSKAVQSIPFIVITVLLIVGEVIKQIKCIQEGYDYWNIPLHFCSTYFVWLSLAEFSFGKMRKTMQNIAFVATVYLFVGMYYSPSGIFGDACDHIFENYLDTHTVLFHHLVILYFMLSIALKRFQPKKKDAWVWMGCFALYFTVAAICAYRLNENYFNILDSENIPFMETFRLWAGQVVYNAVLGFVAIFMGAIFIRIAVRIREKFATEEIEVVEVVEESSCLN